jgi:signal transduction histidine kinase
VEDDGAGFTPAADGFPKGTGLFGMRERVSLVDGRFDVSSCLDGGTIVTASIPVTAPDRSSLHASSRE